MNISSLYGRPLAVAAKLVPPAQAELDRLQLALDTLHRQHAPLTFDVATAVPGSVGALVDWREKLKAAQEAVADARLVLDEAQKRDRAVEDNKRREAFKGQVSALRQHLARREKAAREISNHVQNLEHEWRTLIDVGHKIDSIIGSANLRNENALVNVAALTALVQNEFYRVGAGPQSSNGQYSYSLPGSAPSDFRLTPSQTPSLVDKVKQSGAWLLEQMQPTTAPPTAPAAPTRSAAAQVIGPTPPASEAPVAVSSDAEIYNRLVALKGTTDGLQIHIAPKKLSA